MKIEINKKDMEALARCLLPYIVDFYDSDDGRKEFEEWKQRKTAEEEHNEQNDTDKT